MKTHELNFEEYRALIRAIKNVDILLGYRSLDDDSEPEFEAESEPDLGYESGNESDIETINESDNVDNASTLETKSDEVIDV